MTWTSGHCPIDNVNLNVTADIFLDNYTKREIREIKLNCPFESKGCPLKLSPLELEAHMAECTYDQAGPSHAMQCPFHTVGCKDVFKVEEELNKHLQDDLHNHMNYLMRACSDNKMNRDITRTAEQLQLSTSLGDPKKKNGNPFSNNDVHTLLNTLYERIVVLEQRDREKSILIENLSKQLDMLTHTAARRTCFGEFLWRVDGISGHIATMKADHNRIIYSEPFYTSPYGYKFCLRLNISQHNSNYLALNLHLMKSPHDDCLTWPFSGSFTITMVNRYRPDLSEVVSMASNPAVLAFTRPTLDRHPRGFGYQEYGLIDEIMKMFVNEDMLTFKVVVTCK
ncbi:TNF receptor-associated factor 6 [Eumeta japonica]|uniref:TNF receptor-associated factor 6 n=1 Tax=Eumeta variegata TaxID=151549 RepID=A0A4C1WCS8_EUMVA|nr:TNF receptor-associated factor 6 [Eumeta japonica]